MPARGAGIERPRPESKTLGFWVEIAVLVIAGAVLLILLTAGIVWAIDPPEVTF